MKRGKKPPTPEIIQLASVISDLLELGRREEAVAEVQTLVPIAIAEYLRRFPAARNMADRVWVFRPNWKDKEIDHCCFFCRESIVTLPTGRSLTLALQDKLDAHGELCGVAGLAGLSEWVGPKGEAPKVDKPKSNAAKAIERLLKASGA